MTKILATGGAGFIGTHTCVALQRAGYTVSVLDNFANSHPEALKRVTQITGEPVEALQCDITNYRDVESAIDTLRPDTVIHFAGLKAVGESASMPLEYYNNNVIGTLHLLSAMQNHGIKSLVFSSSATVYGSPQKLPIDEEHPLSATSVYGRTKLIIEDILSDLFESDAEWRIAILRYFNPCGAHESGLIGEDPTGVPNNLMPFIAQVAAGRRDYLNIWGNDYPTPDGTGVRDYIHVMDLARGHVAAVDYLASERGLTAINLGTGQGYSVLEIVTSFSVACGRQLPYKFGPRRRGDIATCYADPTKALELLGWRASAGIAEMCEDHWRWQKQNPFGFAQP